MGKHDSSSGSGSSRRAHREKGGSAHGRPLSEFPLMLRALGGFVEVNCAIESTDAVLAARRALEPCKTLEEAFAAALREKVFTFDAALRWVFFLSQAPGRLAPEDEPAFADAPPALQPMMDQLAAVYDRSLDEAVTAYFDPSDDEDSDASSDASEGAQSGAGSDAD